ncbi:MAG TPA: GNAT family protein [Anaerolineae bacterium]|nr:GNAT family protein [Anaerolineae bacterium]
MELLSARLRLRSFEMRDVAGFVAYRSEPEVARYQSWEAPYSEGQGVAFVREMMGAEAGRVGEWYQLAIELRETGELLGDCAFCVLAEDGQQAEIGYTLATRAQGYGYGREAVSCLLDYLFVELGLHRVRAICDVENEASVRLLTHLGWRREGHMVENVWFKGSWGSEYLYALLRREWLALRAD